MSPKSELNAIVEASRKCSCKRLQKYHETKCYQKCQSKNIPGFPIQFNLISRNLFWRVFFSDEASIYHFSPIIKLLLLTGRVELSFRCPL